MTYIEDLFCVKGKIAVVTGGLGILGTEYVTALVKAGAKVAVWDVKEADDGHVLKSLSDEGEVMFDKVDISKREDVQAAADRIVAKWGVPNVLLNNAAVDFPPQAGAALETFENYSTEKWQAIFAVNLTGMIHCCQVIGGMMAENDGGSIINVSSMYGMVSPDQRIYKDFIKPFSYTVTKSGVFGLTKYLATYWGAKKVRVNTLTPGGVLGKQDPEFIRKYSDKSPLGRMANKDEYCGAVIFLASDASSYMTGANLVMDGGWTAW